MFLGSETQHAICLQRKPRRVGWSDELCPMAFQVLF